MEGSESFDRQRQEALTEQARILAALGELVQGGIVDNIQHVGATSVAQVPAGSRLDLALSVTPFPLETNAQAKLEELGYALDSEQSSKHEQRFQHISGAYQLFVSEVGSDEWMNHLLIRDFLQADERARQRYIAQRNLQSKDALFTELLVDAKLWWVDHHGWGPVEFVRQELEGCGHPWYISSGWALDLFLGKVSRVHLDVDVVVARADQLALREQMTKRGWTFLTPLKAKLEPWPPHMRLEMPRHQLHAHREGRFIDFLLTDVSHDLWRYRRDPIVIRRLEQAWQQTSEGIPFLAPELVLLFKSRNTSAEKRERNKDQEDFERVYPHLQAEARAWLRWALIATEPKHAWIALLA